MRIGVRFYRPQEMFNANTKFYLNKLRQIQNLIKQAVKLKIKNIFIKEINVILVLVVWFKFDPQLTFAFPPIS